MTTIRKTAAAAPVAAKAPAPVAKAAEKQAATLDRDFFKRTGPDAAAVKVAKEAIAALATMPKVPLLQSQKAGWLADAKPRLEAARKGLDTLRDAEWAGTLPQAELDAARDAVNKFADKVEGVEVRAGLRPAPKPLNPFRPTFQLTKGLANGVPDNAFGGLIAAFGLMVTIPVDIVDMATRPIQALVWPLAHAWRGIQWTGRQIGLS